VLKQTNNRRAGLSGDLLSLGAVQAMSALLPLATVPYLLRVVGLEAFGWYNLSLALMNFGVAWVDFGFTLTGSRDKSTLDADSNAVVCPDTEVSSEANTLFSRFFFTQLLLLGICLPMLFLLVMSIPSWRQHALFFLSSALLLPAQVLMPAWWLQGSRQFALLARWLVFGRLLFAGGVFSLIESREDQLLLPLLNGGSTFLVAAAAFFQVIYLHKIKIEWPGWASCRGMLRANRPVFAGGISNALYAHSTLIILELFAGVRWLGIVSALEKILLVFRMAASSLQQV
jgi:PST family polysaccharide transporter